MSLLEEVPGVIHLDARKLGEFFFFLLGAEGLVGDGRCEDGGQANGTSHEPVILAGDQIEDGGTETSHEAGGGKEGGGSDVSSEPLKYLWFSSSRAGRR